MDGREHLTLDATDAASLHEVRDLQRQAAAAVVGVAGPTTAASSAVLLRGIHVVREDRSPLRGSARARPVAAARAPQRPAAVALRTIQDHHIAACASAAPTSSRPACG